LIYVILRELWAINAIYLFILKQVLLFYFF